jgi:hypothetical protein
VTRKPPPTPPQPGEDRSDTSSVDDPITARDERQRELREWTSKAQAASDRLSSEDAGARQRNDSARLPEPTGHPDLSELKTKTLAECLSYAAAVLRMRSARRRAIEALQRDIEGLERERSDILVRLGARLRVVAASIDSRLAAQLDDRGRSEERDKILGDIGRAALQQRTRADTSSGGTGGLEKLAGDLFRAADRCQADLDRRRARSRDEHRARDAFERRPVVVAALCILIPLLSALVLVVLLALRAAANAG